MVIRRFTGVDPPVALEARGRRFPTASGRRHRPIAAGLGLGVFRSAADDDGGAGGFRAARRQRPMPDPPP